MDIEIEKKQLQAFNEIALDGDYDLTQCYWSNKPILRFYEDVAPMYAVNSLGSIDMFFECGDTDIGNTGFDGLTSKWHYMDDYFFLINCFAYTEYKDIWQAAFDRYFKGTYSLEEKVMAIEEYGFKEAMFPENIFRLMESGNIELAIILLSGM